MVDCLVGIYEALDSVPDIVNTHIFRQMVG